MTDAEHVVAVAVDHAVFYASFRTFTADEVDDDDWLIIARHMHYVEDVIDASVYRWQPDAGEQIDGPGAGANGQTGVLSSGRAASNDRPHRLRPGRR